MAANVVSHKPKSIEWVNEDCMLFKENEYGNTLLTTLDDQRKREEFCDIYLKVENSIYPAHRCVLSSACQYFRTMFSSGLSESTSKEIEMHGFDGELFVDVMKYIYTGVVEIRVCNVEMLMMTANMMQLPNLMEACSNFLQAQMDTDNCLGFFKFAKLHNCPTLLKACRAYIIESFLKIVSCEEFRSLTLKELLDLISIEDLRISSEIDIFEGVLKWILCKFDTRVPFSRIIFEEVRLSTIPLEVIRTSLKNEIVNFALPSDTSLDEEHLLNEILRLRKHQMKSGNLVPRKGCERFIYVIGGYRSPSNVNWFNGDSLTSIERINLSNMSLQSYSIQSLPVPRRCHAVAVVHGCLFVFGGEDDLFITDSIFSFDPVVNKWKKAGSLLTPMCGMQAVPVKNKIFLIGGCIGTDVTASISVYDPFDFSIEEVGSLSVPRAFFACAVYYDQIYVAGGFDTYNLRLSSAEKIDPYPLRNPGYKDKDKVNVTDIAKMNFARAAFAMVSLGDLLYVFGGQGGSDSASMDRHSSSNFIETYNTKTNTWNSLKIGSPFRSLANFCCVAHNGKIFLVGGKDESLNSVSTVWCLNSTLVWSRATNLTLDRCNHAAVVF